MRVLIVEDDDALGMFLEKGLRLEGHDVSLVRDGQSGLEHVLSQVPDLLVLDLTLPCLDGMQVLERLQGKLERTSVLVLSARSGLEERVKCLELGADDCLRKPFSFAELTARCRALGRRRNQIIDSTLCHRGIEVNRLERRVTREGKVVDLTGKEFALLEFLMQARGRCCTRSELLREVWQMSPDAGTNVVDVYVNYLRRKLGAVRPEGDESSDPVIETVRGEGYMIGMGLEKKTARQRVPDGLQGSLRGAEHGVFGMGSRYIA